MVQESVWSVWSVSRENTLHEKVVINKNTILRHRNYSFHMKQSPLQENHFRCEKYRLENTHVFTISRNNSTCRMHFNTIGQSSLIVYVSISVPSTFVWFNFQWHFHARMLVYLHCMNVCLVLIQPLGCQNPINVMLWITLPLWPACWR